MAGIVAPFDPLQLLLEMESEIIDNMTAYLARGSLASAEWQAQKLLEVGALRAENVKTVEKYIAEIQANLYQYYQTIGTDAALSSGIPGLSDVLPEGVSTTLARTWLIWEQQTMNQLKTLGMTLIQESQTTYIQIVYKSAAKMLAGATTLRGATAETASLWLKNGIPALVDKAGREWSVEGYAQMVLRSNERQVMTESQEAAFNEYDIDLVEISSHLGARERCAPYQGRVYSRSGLSTKFPALSKTSKGEIAGLFGANCGHSMYAYNPAVGKTYKPYPVKENENAYQASQQQRLLERNIRKAKREAQAASIDKGGVAEKRAQAKVREAQANMRKFIDESGRTRRRDREQIY